MKDMGKVTSKSTAKQYKTAKYTSAKYTNGVLSEIVKYWKDLPPDLLCPDFKRFTSHSIRHGAVEDLTESKEISFATACLRTGLSLSQVSNMFKYMDGGWKHDSKCAKLFSGWIDLNAGG